MKYFANCKTLDELKKEFRRLCMIHHPDRGGDTATMAAINADEKDLKEINWALVQHKKTVDLEKHPGGAGLDFHILIVRASKNRFMEATVKLLAYEERNIEYKTLKLSTYAHAAAYVDVHRQIMDALLARDADLAEKLMHDHFEEMINSLFMDLQK